jgi:hypothetical protein
MDTVNKIRQVQTGSGGPFPSDVPQTQVIIKSMTRMGPAGSKTDAAAKPTAPAMQ